MGVQVSPSVFFFFFFSIMGALTAKPYAFTSRVWEVERLESLDFFDVFGSSTFLELRGFEILSILPKINYSINGEWLTDRGRFFIDGLFYQRITKPMVRKLAVFIFCSWSFVFLIFFFFKKLLNFYYKKSFDVEFRFSKSYVFFSDFLVGEDEDLSRLVTLEIIKGLFGNSTSLLSNNCLNVLENIDVFSNFSNKQLIDSDVVILVGFDVRTDVSLLYSNLRSLVISKGLKLVVFGNIVSQLDCKFFFGGLTFLDFFRFLVGQHQLSKLLTSGTRLLFLLGYAAFSNYQDIDRFWRLLDQLRFGFWQNIYVIPFYSVNGLAYLNASLCGFFSGVKDLFVFSDFNKKFGLCEFSYILEFYAISFYTKFLIDFFFLYKIDLTFLFLINNNSVIVQSSFYDFVVYIGHHGDLGGLNSHLVLPFNLLYERNNIYITVFNVLQKSNFATYISGQSVGKDILLFFPFIFRYFFDMDYAVNNFFCQQLYIDYLYSGFRFIGSFQLVIYYLEFRSKITSDFVFLSLLYDSFKVDSISKASKVLVLASLMRFENSMGLKVY